MAKGCSPSDLIQFHDLREVSDDQLKAWLGDLADNLRASDLTEIDATSEYDPLMTLVISVMLSDMAWVLTCDGRPMTIFGCSPEDQPPGEAIVWMLGSPQMDEPRNALTIARNTAPYLGAMLAAYPRLWNHIDARNTKSMRWLKWSGFNVISEHPGFGRNGELFYLFERTADLV